MSGKDLICYRNKDELDIRVMHCLTNTFIQETQPEINPDNGLQLYPVKIVLPPNQSRVLYFGDQETAHKWAKAIKAVVGEACVKDFYELGQNLGKGQFGVVKLAKHKKSRKQVAIKTITKANMKPIEIF